MSEVLCRLHGVVDLTSKILEYGTDQAEHEANLRHTLQCPVKHSIMLNREKCVFGVQEIIILGVVASKYCFKPDLHKSEAIKIFDPPHARCQMFNKF